MALDIRIPQAGESVTEGVLARWLKKDGDLVKSGEAVLELETDKATMEVTAPADGVLKIRVPEGKTVQVNAVVGAIEEGKRDEKPVGKPAEKSAQPDDKKTTPSSPPTKKTEAPESKPTAPEQKQSANAVETKPPSPNTPPAELVVSKPAPPTPATQQSRETRQSMSAIRQRIAERLVASQKNTATLTTFNEADMVAIMDLRSRYKERFRELYHANLGFMSFFVKACIDALKTHPLVNARIDGSDIVLQNFYDVGVAVSTERGLIVPVLRDADRLSFAEIENQIEELARKAREGKIAVTDLQGGTFTITNGGVFGSLLSTPILNPPQSAILGMHTIQKRAVVVEDQIVIRPMMYLALSYDHRLIDGREAVQFLVRVKECIEHPERMLLKI